jgi:hypothetical protein
MEGTVERIEATQTKNNKNKWRVWIGGEEHTDWDRPNYVEGDHIHYTLQEKEKDGGGTWKTVRDARTTNSAAKNATPTVGSEIAAPTDALLAAAVAMANGKAKFTDVYSNYLALKDMVLGKEDEPEPTEPEEEGPPI